MSSLLNVMSKLVPWMQRRAEALDLEAAFPTEETDRLHQRGVLSLSLPALGVATADQLATLLCLIGPGNLSVGRVIEVHINGFHLIARYGTVQHRDRPRFVGFGSPIRRKTGCACGVSATGSC